MITSKHIDKIIAVLVALAFLFASIIIIFPEAFTSSGNVLANQLAYPQKLFAENQIMSIEISVDQETWDNMLENASDKEYISCDVTINGTTFYSVGVRPKGNSSLSQLENSDSTRYSLKFEFDHYIKGQTCFGLDKFVVNNIQADSTYMKEYLSYKMLDYIGVEGTQLCAFTDISVNGEKWGFYLAVEGVEESFATRVYGSNYGKLYKPETTTAGVGGNKDHKDEKSFDTDENMNADLNMFNNQNMENKFENVISGADQTVTVQGNNENQDNTNTAPPDGNANQGNTDAVPPDGNLNQGDNNEVPPNAPDGNNEALNPNKTEQGQGLENNMPADMPNDFPFSNSEFDGNQDRKMGGMGNEFGSGGGADLVYSDDNIDSYQNIFDEAVFDSTTDSDKQRVIEAIKNLNEGTDLEKYVNVDQVLRYFAANTVMVNLDSYICNMKHNYYLYENNGQISIIPWDYNLSYAGFQAGSASEAVNFPIDTPTASGTELSERPLIGKLLEVDEYKELYHSYIKQIVDGFLNNEDFSNLVDQTDALISDYVKSDPSAEVTFEEYQKAVSTLKEYANLRSQSILGQLDGTIPSTREGQNADSSNLIDASSINISDMGTQGGGGNNLGGGMDKFSDIAANIKGGGFNPNDDQNSNIDRKSRSMNNQQATTT